MRFVAALLGAVLLFTSACLQVQPQPAPPPATISSWSPLGGFTVTSGSNCGGHVTLTTTTATINDACFTGASDVVLCTDSTSVAAVKCTPGYGIMTVTGTAGDVISYARVK
jgi:hypothetical protein